MNPAGRIFPHYLDILPAGAFCPITSITQEVFKLKIYTKFRNIIEKISAALAYLAAFVLLCMGLISFVDVFLRYFFHTPIEGANEIIQHVMVIITYGVSPYALLHGHMVSVDAVTSKLGDKANAVLRIFTLVVSFGCMIVMSDALISKSLFYIANPLHGTHILRMPYYPFYIFTALACILITIVCIILIVDSIIVLAKKKSESPEVKHE